MTKSKYTVLLSPMTFATVFSVLVVSLGALLPLGTASGGNFLTTLTVSGSGRTQTIIKSSVKSSTYGQPVTFKATVTPLSGIGVPTGTVQFLEGTKTLGTRKLRGGTATFIYQTSPQNVPGLAVGTHQIAALYGVGQGGAYRSSKSRALTLTVKKATTTTKLLSSANPSVFGQSVTFTATIWTGGEAGAPALAGSVQFQYGSEEYIYVPYLIRDPDGGLANVTFTISSLAVGTHIITAVYTGSRNFAGSVSKKLTEIVNSVAVTSTTTTTTTTTPPTTTTTTAPPTTSTTTTTSPLGP